MTPSTASSVQSPYIYLTQRFPPEATGVAYALFAAMEELGIPLQVVAGIPLQSSGNVTPGYKPWRRYRETAQDSSLIRVPLFPSHSESTAGRIANYASFALSATLFAWRPLIRGSGVVLYGSPVTAGLLPLIGKRIFGKPYLVLVEDLWPDSLRDSSITPRGRTGHKMVDVAAWFSDLIYRNANLLVAITDGMAHELRARGYEPEQVSVVMNWAKREFDRPVESSGRLKGLLGLDESTTVLLYAGNIGSTHELPEWIRAVTKFAEGPPVSLVFMGDGAARQELENLAGDLRSTNVHFLDRVDDEDFFPLLADADAVIVSLRRGTGLKTAMPSKIPTALAAGKIILASVDGDSANAVRQGGGFVSRDGSPSALMEMIDAFLKESNDERESRMWQAIEYYSTAMSRETGKQQLLQSLRSAFEPHEWDGSRQATPAEVGRQASRGFWYRTKAGGGSPLGSCRGFILGFRAMGRFT